MNQRQSREKREAAMKQIEPDPPEQENEKGEKRKTRHKQTPHHRVIPRRQGLELRLRPRRTVIKPREKRHDYIRRLDKAIETLEEILNSEEADEKTRIQAANALARLISTSYVMVQDIDIENIEEEVENLKKMLKEHEEKQGLGYNLEGEDGQTLVWDSQKNEWVPKNEIPKE
jgi:hypothetical protein